MVSQSLASLATCLALARLVCMSLYMPAICVDVKVPNQALARHQTSVAQLRQLTRNHEPDLPPCIDGATACKPSRYELLLLLN